MLQVGLEGSDRGPPEQTDPLLAALADHPDLTPLQVDRPRSAAASSLMRKPAA
jgi:hypothetical protein